jgi:hypothetical protein
MQDLFDRNGGPFGRLRRLATLACIGAALAPGTAQGQRATPSSVAGLLHEFATGPVGGSGRALHGIGHILAHRDSMKARADSIVAGLEDLALTGPSSRVRSHAVGLLGMSRSSSDRAFHADVVIRLGRIHRRSTDPAVRLTAISQLGFPWRDAHAVRLLAAILEGTPAAPAFEEEPEAAASSLARLGPEGRRALRSSHDGKRIRSARAQSYVGGLIQRGFRP